MMKYWVPRIEWIELIQSEGKVRVVERKIDRVGEMEFLKPSWVIEVEGVAYGGK